MTSSAPHEPRKYPHQRRAQATVEAILIATAHILETKGLAACNTNLIAERAGVSIGSLYQYFPTKEAILATLIRQERQRLLEALLAMTPDPQSGCQATISKLIELAVAHQLQRPQLSRLLEYAEAALPLDAETEQLRHQIVAQVTTIFATYPLPDAETAARDVVAMAHGMIDSAGRDGEVDATALRKRVERAVWGYLSMPG